MNVNFNMPKIFEAMRGKRAITSPQIARYIEECIAVMKQIKFGFKDEEKILTYNDIDTEEGSTISTFGVMSLPTRGSNNFKLVLNKHMFTESEEAIKNTIYHELCHYVVSKIAINLDIIYTKNGKWYHNKSSHYNFSDFKGHGYQWKRVANIVGRATKQNITRTNTYDVHTGVGAFAETKYKYIVKCKNCSKEFKYTKRTKFINAVLAGNGYTENWWCNCPDGRKGHYFEIIKGNN